MRFLTTTLFATFILFFSTQPSLLAGSVGRNSQTPQTDTLIREFNLTRNSLASSKSRIQRLQGEIKDCRQKVKDLKSLLDQVRKIESQIAKVKKQIDSLAKVPPLKALRLVATGLKALQKPIVALRKKADALKKNVVEPVEKKLATCEKKVNTLAKKVENAKRQTDNAATKLGKLKSFVSMQRKPRATAALESLSRPAITPVRSVRSLLVELDSECAAVEAKLSNLSTTTQGALSLKQGVDKVAGKLAPIEKKANDLDKVMTKEISFKIPFSKKTVSLSVRKVLESPDKIIKIAEKPLKKMADKLLAPLKKKLNFDVKPPKELQELSKKLDSLNSMKLDLGRSMKKFTDITKSESFEQLRQRTSAINAKKLKDL